MTYNIYDTLSRDYMFYYVQGQGNLPRPFLNVWLLKHSMTKSVLVGDQMIQSVRGQVLSRCADMSISGRSEYKNPRVWNLFFSSLQNYKNIDIQEE